VVLGGPIKVVTAEIASVDTWVAEVDILEQVIPVTRVAFMVGLESVDLDHHLE
jgi:hypothetical protein